MPINFPSKTSSQRVSKQTLQLLYARDVGNGDAILETMADRQTNPAFQWLQGRAGVILRQGQGNLLEAANSINKKQGVVLILPAHQGLLTTVDMPSSKPAHVRNALPFALAPKVLGDVNTMQLAWRRCVDSQYIQVAGYDKLLLAKLLAACKTQGLRIQHVLLDAQIVPQQSNQWTLIADEQQWLLSYGNNQCINIQNNMRAILLQQLWATVSPAESTKINIIGPDASAAKAVLEATPFSSLSLVTPETAFARRSNADNESTLTALFAGYDSQQLISLLPSQTVSERLNSLWQKVDRQFMQWVLYCVLLLMLLLFVRNDLLQTQLQRLQMSVSRLQQAVAQELSKLPVPQNLSQRIDDLKQLPATVNIPMQLLDSWALIRASMLANDAEFTLATMVYSNNQLRLVWLADNAQQAKEQQTIIDQQRATVGAGIGAGAGAYIDLKLELSVFKDQRADNDYGQQILTLHFHDQGSE